MQFNFKIQTRASLGVWLFRKESRHFPWRAAKSVASQHGRLCGAAHGHHLTSRRSVIIMSTAIRWERLHCQWWALFCINQINLIYSCVSHHMHTCLLFGTYLCTAPGAEKAGSRKKPTVASVFSESLSQLITTMSQVRVLHHLLWASCHYCMNNFMCVSVRAIFRALHQAKRRQAAIKVQQ